MLLLAAVHRSAAMLTAGFRGQIQSQSTLCIQRYRKDLSQRSHWCTHTLNTVSRTTDEVALLLLAERSAERAPVDTDF